jgi:hypothetical protein
LSAGIVERAKPLLHKPRATPRGFFLRPIKHVSRSAKAVLQLDSGAEAGLANYHSKVKSKVEVMRGYLGQSALSLEFARGFAYVPAANPG